MKHEIDIEGLPEGWAIKELKFTAGSIENITPGYPEYEPSITSAKLRCYVIAEKIQPRRIVLEETPEVFHIRESGYRVYVNGTIQFIENAMGSDIGEKIWREVKQERE